MRSNSEFKLSVRKRIIFHDPAEDLILYEGKLAQEFGVSRTPVRQVLQSLAAEWLVEVRSGVGTVASPLIPENRDRDIKSFLAICEACSGFVDYENLADIEIGAFTLKTRIKNAPAKVDQDFFFDIANEIRDAFVACYWRFIRRLIAEMDGDSPKSVTVLASIVEQIQIALEQNPPSNVLAGPKSVLAEVF